MEVKLNKLVIVLALVLALSLSACSLVGDYLPENNESNATLNDTFEFTEDVTTTDNLTSETTQVTEEDEESEAEAEGLVFSTITVVEGDLISLKDFYAEDPDGDDVDYTYEEPFNEAGLWQTNEGDEGKYLTTVVASDGLLSTAEEIQIIIRPSNKAPLIDCEDEYTFTEGELIELPCVIYDKEGDEVTYTVSGFMDDLTYQTTYDDAGEQEVLISATDGNKVATKEIELEILNTNRAPELMVAIDPINATELETISLNVQVVDPDGDEVQIEYPYMFDENGTWTPQRGDAGTYELEVIVSDDAIEHTFPVSIVINKVNLPPTFETIEPITVYEGDLISLPINITDEEEVIVTYSGFMTSRRYQTTYDDAGNYEVFITASDGTHEVQQTVDITILNVNRPPVFIDE